MNNVRLMNNERTVFDGVERLMFSNMMSRGIAEQVNDESFMLTQMMF